uniref:Double-strand break repair protein n=1 Tax=Glossina palpalis gambiensis TaxID=67801 RepID=A0A1B0BIS2_9MUSC
MSLGDGEIALNDIMRIMISTDNHLGYGEKDPNRGEDSFIAFEEMLELAVKEDVDFILLGGDLFHDAVPSQYALFKCMNLLRMYTFGDKPIAVELIDGNQHFHGAINESVNYEDPNLNVAIPVYSIHGNHDDSSSFGGLSSLDLLSTTGLINYFGRCTDLSKVEISPILMKKGATRLALYGLSHIHDARLSRLFESRKVHIQAPSDHDSEWFHLMVVHQNRADRGLKNYLPEIALPEFLNLIIWGHEHDCHIEPQFNAQRNFYVSQPGSSVCTSLSEGEALQKHVGILEIYKDKFQMKPIPLKTVRPFVFESVNVANLADELHLDEGDVSNKVRDMAEKRATAMIEKAKELVTDHVKQPKLPNIRLRIDYLDEEQMFNHIRLGQIFNDRVANPADMIHFKKMTKKAKAEKSESSSEKTKVQFQRKECENITNVEDLVELYYNNSDESKSLKVLSSKVLAEVCHQVVERNDNNAAENLINSYQQKALDYLMDNKVAEENVNVELQKFKQGITSDDIFNLLGSSTQSLKQNTTNLENSRASNSDNENSDNDCLPLKNVRATGGKKKETRTAVSKKGGTTGRGRGSADNSRSSGATTRSSRVMPQLEISTKSISSSRQNPLESLIRKDSKRQGKSKIIELSDNSD